MSDFSRQSALVPTAKMESYTHHVVGCGAIGREVAMQLASMGAKYMYLYDFDSVDESNVVTQGYGNDYLGRLKVEALADSAQNVCRDGASIIGFNRRITRLKGPEWRSGQPEATFACMDNIFGREVLYEHWLMSDSDILIDGRVLGETIRVITCKGTDPETYKETLFPQHEAVQGVCSAQMTIYSARICAGIMCHNLARHLRGFPLMEDVTFDLLSGMFIHNKETTSVQA